ncbi:MAG: LEA type 2 family protein [Pyrinomonadaceae bacterium]|nr:LEA type 2 family protein [Phycisphaerales bacterium]
MRFTVNASHDNDKVLPLREAHYALEVNGQRVFSGIRSAQCTLSRFGSQQFTIPAAVPAASLTGLSGDVVSYRLSGTLTYITPGALAELLFDTGVSRPSVGFSHQGTLDLSTLMSPGAKIGMAGK